VRRKAWGTVGREERKRREVVESNEGPRAAELGDKYGPAKLTEPYLLVLIL
jgi:hypothetical protein